MKVSPPTALAVWAIASAWMVLFLVLERWDPPGLDTLDWIEIIAAIAGIACFPLVRKAFAAWLAKTE